MGVGGSAMLLGFGAILTFAVDYELGWLDLAVVGWVLMLAGAIALAVVVSFWGRRRRERTVSERRVCCDGAPSENTRRGAKERCYDPPTPPV